MYVRVWRLHTTVVHDARTTVNTKFWEYFIVHGTRITLTSWSEHLHILSYYVLCSVCDHNISSVGCLRNSPVENVRKSGRKYLITQPHNNIIIYNVLDSVPPP